MVLRDTVASAKNIAVVSEGPIEEWIAIAGGGFKRATFDLPALLYDADLLHLYDPMLHLELSDLWRRYEEDRVAFLAYLKDECGLNSLADRQHFANALARAKRLGLYDTTTSSVAAPPTASEWM